MSGSDECYGNKTKQEYWGDTLLFTQVGQGKSLDKETFEQNIEENKRATEERVLGEEYKGLEMESRLACSRNSK